MAKNYLKFLYGLFICLYVSACTSGASIHKNPFQEQVVVQVCIPNKRIYFDTIHVENVKNHPITKYSSQELALAPKTIRRVASFSDTRLAKDPRGTREVSIPFTDVTRNRFVASTSSSHIAIADSTTSGQPIYEIRLMTPASDYVGLEVVLPKEGHEGNKNNHYWFKLPSSISKKEFSGWYSPASMESGMSTNESLSVERETISGRKMPIYPVDKYSPKMRVILKLRERHDNPVNDYLPAITTAKNKFEKPNITSEFFKEFVPQENENVPSCN